MSARARRLARSRLALVAALAAVLATGVLIDRLTGPPAPGPQAVPPAAPEMPAATRPNARTAAAAPPGPDEPAPAAAPPAAAPGTAATRAAGAAHASIEGAFERGVALLREGDPGRAVEVFHAIISERPDMPEAQVNLGYALFADGRPEAARRAFQSAIDLKPTQINAYWGLAVTLEALGDLRGALGAMRSYVHLTSEDDPFLPRARAALWEWESRLARPEPGTRPVGPELAEGEASARQKTP